MGRTASTHQLCAGCWGHAQRDRPGPGWTGLDRVGECGAGPHHPPSARLRDVRLLRERLLDPLDLDRQLPV